MTTRIHAAAWQSIAEEREREIERLQTAFSIAHGALLCIGGTDSNWSEYARKTADDAAAIMTHKETTMTNEELAREITYALIKAGHVHNSKFEPVSRLIKERLDSRADA